MALLDDPVQTTANYARTMEQCLELAKTLGRTVKLPAANELQLDIDSEEELNGFRARFARLKKILGRDPEKILGRDPGDRRGGEATWTKAPSPSGKPGRYHVTVTLPRVGMTHVERIVLQAVLGSDPMREVLNFRRWQYGDEQPTLFFELEDDQ
jgi:hypothetical protein